MCDNATWLYAPRGVEMAHEWTGPVTSWLDSISLENFKNNEHKMTIIELVSFLSALLTSNKNTSNSST